MHVIFATDNNYVQHCCVAIASVLVNNTNVCIHVFTEGLTSDNISLIETLVNKYNGTIKFYVIRASDLKGFPMPKEGGQHISIATYYRLFVAQFLPHEIDTCLYLDCDIVVRGSLHELFQTDLENKALGCVYQRYSPMTSFDMERLSIPYEEGYFNAGVLLINLAYWRDNNVQKELMDFIKNKFNCIKQHDQDVLNAVLYKRTVPISNTWNYLPNFFSKEELIMPNKVSYLKFLENPIIVHYVSVPKPWEFGASHPFKSDYYRYLGNTPFKGWKPNFNSQLYYRHIFCPWIVRMVGMIDIFNLRKNKIMKIWLYNKLRRYVIFFRYYRDKHSYVFGSKNKYVNHGITISNKRQISGEHNQITIEKNAVVKLSKFIIKGNHNTIIIKENAHISDVEFFIEDNNCSIIVGESTYIGYGTQLACSEDNSTICIGSDCMLSSLVQMRTGDSHSILDERNCRINKAQSIMVGNHCWLGQGSRILKGVLLKENTVVSTGGIVTKSFGGNVLIGGIPAKVLKENINWNSRRL